MTAQPSALGISFSPFWKEAMVSSVMSNPDPTADRRDEVVKRMLATPPQKRAPKKGDAPKDAPKVDQAKR